MKAAEKLTAHIKPLLLILSILVVSRLLFTLLMPATYSKDLYAWLDVIEFLKSGGNPYKDMRVLNWPPFWMQFIYVIGKVSAATSISATHLFQALLVLAEAGVVIACYALLLKVFKQKKVTTAIIVSLALNPVCIFLNCQHCNFDVFVGFWVLLFAYALLDFYEHKNLVSWLAACFILGLGILTKTVPFLLTPLLIPGIQKQKPSVIIFGILLLFMPVVTGMSIIYTLSPEGVTNHVLHYRSQPGWYGVSGILNLLSYFEAIYKYGSVSAGFMPVMMLIVGIRLRKKELLRPTELVTAILTLLVFVPTFGPGYSPPYVLWYLPMLTVYYFMATAATRKVMLAGYVILALTYITEYTFFDSHGSFIRHYDPSDKMAALCDYLGQSTSQSFIRLPMFAVYVVFYVLLLRDKNNAVTHSHIG